MSGLLQQLLGERQWLLADGATGTNLFAMGLAHGEAPEVWNLQEQDKVRAHYRSFIEAGSDIVLSNSFGGTANRLALHGLDDRVGEVNRIAAKLLADEIEASGRKVVCAGSVGPTGDLFHPLGPLTHDTGVAAFQAQMQGLADGGADVVWIETISSEEELAAALEAADRVGLPAVCTLSFDTNGRTMMGITPSRLFQLMHGWNSRPLAFGGNCGTGASDLLVGLLSALAEMDGGDIVVTKANCGVPKVVGGEVRYTGTTQLMARYALMARDMGVRIIGGCCGTTAEHVRAMREALQNTPMGTCPDADALIEALGPLTGSTADLMLGDGEVSEASRARDERRRGRRRRAS